MDFQEAIDAHLAWKRHLYSGLRTGNWALADAENLGSETECPFGQWLQQLPEGCFSNPLFNAMRKEHSEFHRAASSLSEKLNEFPSPTERMLMEGRLQEASDRLVATLNLLKLQGKLHHPALAPAQE